MTKLDANSGPYVAKPLWQHVLAAVTGVAALVVVLSLLWANGGVSGLVLGAVLAGTGLTLTVLAEAIVRKRTDEEIGNPPDTATDDLNALSHEEVIRRAERAAQTTLAKAQNQAEGILTDAETRSEEMLRQAREKAEALQADAEREQFAQPGDGHPRPVRTIVVGTDGSDSSMRAVDRAGEIAAGANAKLIVATAFFPQSEDQRAADVLKDEGYKLAGNAPIYAILREARDRAKAAGAINIQEKAIVGAPVEALVDLADEVRADLLVVGNVGLSTIAGRMLGSVPSNISRRSKMDVLIVHTTD